jgi:hypothetical protein
LGFVTATTPCPKGPMTMDKTTRRVVRLSLALAPFVASSLRLRRLPPYGFERPYQFLRRRAANVTRETLKFSPPSADNRKSYLLDIAWHLQVSENLDKRIKISRLCLSGLIRHFLLCACSYVLFAAASASFTRRGLPSWRATHRRKRRMQKRDHSPSPSDEAPRRPVRSHTGKPDHFVTCGRSRAGTTYPVGADTETQPLRSGGRFYTMRVQVCKCGRLQFDHPPGKEESLNSADGKVSDPAPESAGREPPRARRLSTPAGRIVRAPPQPVRSSLC